MKQWIIVSAVVVWSACFFAAETDALILRGHMPIHNGMYWDFSDNETVQKHAWAVLGRFTRSDAGPLIILARQGQGFLALKEEWDGLYMYGEYRALKPFKNITKFLLIQKVKCRDSIISLRTYRSVIPCLAESIEMQSYSLLKGLEEAFQQPLL